MGRRFTKIGIKKKVRKFVQDARLRKLFQQKKNRVFLEEVASDVVQPLTVN